VREAGAGYRRIEQFLHRAWESLGSDDQRLIVHGSARPSEFDNAMNDDLAVPQALAVLHEHVRLGNSALADGSDVSAQFAAVLAMTDVLGINPWAEPWCSQADSAGTSEVLDALVGLLLQQRQDARQRKDFAAADAIRDTLSALGITIEDGADGSRWSMGDERGR